MIGHIFNIQKFSLHDGPGIRTTVFFKGCNLRCKWCANPESQVSFSQLTMDMNKCARCGRCVDACPNHARRIKDEYPEADMALCSLCGVCMELCPAGAIGREGEEMSVEDVLSEAMKDQVFYRQSGGGVTFSGGEVLLQQEFATALARVLHENGINVAIETAAAVPGNRFCDFLKEVDYIFVDLKHYDSAAHRAGTGIGNEQIIENIRSVRESGIAYTLRIPVIPGYNDSLEDAAGFAKLLTSMDIDHVQLLPFHQMGEQKYRLLGREYAYSGQCQLHPEDLENYRQILLENGVKAHI